jgi:IS30 family transposase
LNLFEARNIDLRRKVRYRPRKKKTSGTIKDTKCRAGRTYDDFKAFLSEHPDTAIVEMDTVEGKKGSKVLLTLFFRNCSLMLAILLESSTQKCVKSAIDTIYDAMSNQDFKDSFPIILTDNGSEFKDPQSIEYDISGNPRTKVFYCNPHASQQKGRIEKNHEYIRYILPKGKSFDSLTQEKATLMINHINSAARASRNGTTPFKLAQLLLNGSLLDALSLVEISPDEVHLKPALLK